MLIATAPAAPAATTPGCISTTDCLSKMTLGEKAGQMTQAAWNYLKSDSDISTYGLGSLLSGGGGGPNGAGGTAAQQQHRWRRHLPAQHRDGRNA